MITKVVSILLFVVLYIPMANAAINCPADKDNEFKSVVKLIKKVSNDELHCTGTIVQNCFILTAAHCVFHGRPNYTFIKPEQLTVKGGARSEVTLSEVESIFPHPDYKKRFDKMDVALMKLKSCSNEGMPMEFGPFKADRNVTVGGYGTVQLNAFASQPLKRMGHATVKRLDEKNICLGSATIAADGKTVSDSSDCIPTGQDSGSPLIQGGKVRGVHFVQIQKWLAGGSTVVMESCYVNLQDPVVRNFIEETISNHSSFNSSAPEKRTPIAK